jgi:hypothetical protein
MTTSYAKDQPSGFTNRIERVAIIGVRSSLPISSPVLPLINRIQKASGQMGRPITEAILQTGKHTVTALTRGSSNLPPGVKSVPVDYDNEASLVSALRGQQVLIITLSTSAPPDTHDKIVTAAAKAGVPHIMPNAWGGDLQSPALQADQLLGQTYMAHVKKIEELGLRWTSLCSGFWYEFSLGQPNGYGFDLQAKKATLFDDGEFKINTTTWQQCARSVAAWLSLKALPEDENDNSATVQSWTNKPIYISSFRISQRDMLDSIHRVQGTTDSDWEVTREDTKERIQRGMRELQKGERFGFQIVLYTRVFVPSGGDDAETARQGKDNEVLGLPKESLDEATARALKLANS